MRLMGKDVHSFLVLSLIYFHFLVFLIKGVFVIFYLFLVFFNRVIPDGR